ncbi:hypothetical protein [Pleionea sediminis]|uniref:hypothetical protein n=1 Tax=Pleionea sediminis TaxID=2569479 RepID=UPI001184DED3|nr:hypothetical protein [Pleionea sediminis]
MSLNRSLTTRLLLRQLADGKSIVEATQKLKDVEETDISDEIQQLTENYKNTSSWSKAIQLWAPNTVLSMLLDHKKTIESIEPAKFQLINQYSNLSAKSISEIKSEFLAFLSYVSFLLVLSFAIMTIVEIYVLPSFADMFFTISATMPEFSSAITKALPFILIVNAIILIYCFLVLFKLKSHDFLQLPSYILFPLFQPAKNQIKRYHELLVQVANRQELLMNQPRLKVADQFNCLNDEIDLFLNENLESLKQQLRNYLSQLKVVVIALIVTYIFSALVAIYLPIFKLGSTV